MKGDLLMPMNNQRKINHKISGATKVFGIIGQPVKHSLSPMIQNTISSFLNHDNIYTAFPVLEPNKLHQAIQGAHALGIQGFNVTHPYKQDVISLLTHVDPLALKIGAVNTLKYEDEGYSGYNTDAQGLYQSLVQHGISLKGQDIIIIGAGGAARAVAMMVADHGANRIYILNRTMNNGKLLAIEVKKHYNIDIKYLSLEEWDGLPQSTICFQTTSLGMGQTKDQAPIEEDGFYEKITTAVDLIYSPSKTTFLKKAEKQGSYIINGFGMLFYQAVKAYEIWNNLVLTNSQLASLQEQVEKEYQSFNE